MEMIELSKIIENKTYPESGTDLFNILSCAIQNNEKICIDMKDVNSLPTLFLNSSFGKTIELYGDNILKRTIVFLNINKTQAERIQEYIKKFVAVIKGEN